MVTPQTRRWLAARWEHQRRRPPADEELDRLIGDLVGAEVRNREVLALGLPRPYLAARRRLAQKAETIAVADAGPIGDAGVMDYFLTHREDYRLPGRVSFAHACFSTTGRGPAAAEDAREVLGKLQRAGPSAQSAWATRRWWRARSPPRPGPRWQTASAGSSPTRCSRSSRGRGQAQWRPPTGST